MTHMPVDTKRSTDRRTLAFRSFDDLRAEVARLVTAERAGRLRMSGNWSLGTILGHLAFWQNAAFDGIPGPKPGILFRLLGPLVLKRVFLKGMPAGFRLPKVEAGTYGVDELTVDEGGRRLEAAMRRLEHDAVPDRHPILGRMNRDDWITLHLRHAELHLSFLHPS